MSGLQSVERSTDPGLARKESGDHSSRLVRVRSLDPGSAADYLDEWAGESPAAEPIASRPGVQAVERTRADTTLGYGPGGAVVRRQRLAVVETPTAALAAHWSVLEPVSDEDRRTWERLLDRLQGELAGQRGWTA